VGEVGVLDKERDHSDHADFGPVALPTDLIEDRQLDDPARQAVERHL
jgi:hypothetical protein